MFQIDEDRRRRARSQEHLLMSSAEVGEQFCNSIGIASFAT